MKRSTLFLLLALVFMSFGYTVDRQTEDISKIYLIGNTLIRTSPGKEIRFYDLTDPRSPRSLGTITMDGNSDVAVRGSYMYADRNYDLMVFDISNLAQPRPIDTIRKVFSQPYYYSTGINQPTDVGGMSGCGSCSRSDQIASPSTASGETSSGKAGSLARFAIVGDRLYCVDQSTIRIFDISDPARPRYKNTVGLEWGIETIMNEGEHLFIGGQQGMYIYTVGGDEPTFVSQFTHRRNCDPVAVEGARAYVTLRSNNSMCGGQDNQLDILDISNIKNPLLLKSYMLTSPYGLAVRGGMVVVCDGTGGLRVLDVRDAGNVREVFHATDIVPHDVILSGGLMVVSTDGGYVLYDAGDLGDLKKYGPL